MQFNEQDITISNFKKFKIVILGDQSVGKTCLLTRIVYKKFQITSPTVGVDFFVKTHYKNDKTYKLHFWDTAGQERFKALIPNYIKDCQVAIVVYDVTSKKSFESVGG